MLDYFEENVLVFVLQMKLLVKNNHIIKVMMYIRIHHAFEEG